MDVVVIAQLLAAASTFVLAALSFASLLFSREILKETREARIAQDRPQVMVDVDMSDQWRLDVVVKNIGPGAAKNVRFEFSHPLVSAGSGGERKPISELAHFKEGIDYLAPGAEIRTAWGTFANLKPALEAKGLIHGITISSKYIALSPADKTKYETNWNINLLRFAGSPRWARRGEHEIAKAVDSISKDIHRVTSLGRLKVMSKTEEREDERRFPEEELEEVRAGTDEQEGDESRLRRLLRMLFFR